MVLSRHLPGRPEEQNENILIITSRLSPIYKGTISNIGVPLHMWNCHDGNKYPRSIHTCSSASSALDSWGMGVRGITKKWVGACGLISLKATHCKN